MGLCWASWLMVYPEITVHFLWIWLLVSIAGLVVERVVLGRVLDGGVLTGGLRLPDPTLLQLFVINLQHLTQYLINVSSSCIVPCLCVSLKTVFPQFLF